MTIDERIDRLVSSIEAHDRQIENLNDKFDRLTSIMMELAQRQRRTEEAVENLSETVSRLAQIALEDKAEIKRIWEYLMNQTTNGHK